MLRHDSSFASSFSDDDNDNYCKPQSLNHYFDYYGDDNNLDYSESENEEENNDDDDNNDYDDRNFKNVEPFQPREAATPPPNLMMFINNERTILEYTADEI